jgi:hypothetical protein
MNPCAVSTWHGRDKYFDAFMVTSKRNGIDVQNADSEFWPGTDWRDKHWFRKTQAQYDFITKHPEFSHFMFTDSYDVAFAAGWDEITEKYKALNSPLVFAAECCSWPKAEQGALYPHTEHRCKYLNAGFWMGEASAAREFLREAATIASKREQCDQGIFVDLFLSKKHPMKLDTACSICFCCNLDSLDYLEKEDGRPTCIDTKEKPCLFHANGGSPMLTVLAML